MSKLLDRAIEIAVEAHKGQVDKGGYPYINHPLHVMSFFSDEEDMIVAVLHDTIEDTHVTAEYLRSEGFSKEIVDDIVRLSRGKNETNKAYYGRIYESLRAMRVKITDLQHNMDINRIPNPDENDFRRILFYQKLMDRLVERYEQERTK